MSSAAAMMKVELEPEGEACAVCGAAASSEDSLLSCEQHDALAAPHLPPLRAMLLQLNNNRSLPDGRFCSTCIRRASDAYEFSQSLSARGPQPLSDKIRALRRRLHELTQKIDVFIVVGSSGTDTAAGAYSEEDIIMVERGALAAATAADDAELERARNARGDQVYQCTVCPANFQRVAEYRAHAGSHGAHCLHACWTCGAQFATREAAQAHCPPPQANVCHLCDASFQSASQLRAHDADSACASRCPGCGETFAERAALAHHVAAVHDHDTEGPYVCAVCFESFSAAAELCAHSLRHRQTKQFVCGYDGCILRFHSRGSLMAHIRKCHAEAGGGGGASETELAEPERDSEHTCEECGRTFGSGAALKRHGRVHRAPAELRVHDAQAHAQDNGMELELGSQLMEGEGEGEGMEGEVEYLEVETLEDVQFEEDFKP